MDSRVNVPKWVRDEGRGSGTRDDGPGRETTVRDEGRGSETRVEIPCD